MSSVAVYNIKGEKVGEEKLDPEIFDVEVKENLLHRYVVTYLGNKRKNIASAKGRSEVRGGGRKPWKQKGTGRARAGSIRSPLWKGGGVTFGPSTDRNYNKKLNKKEKKLALRMALSVKNKSNNIFLIDKIEFEDIKTKTAAALLKKLKVNSKGVAVVLAKKDDKATKSFRNIDKLDVYLANNINAYHVIRPENIIMSKESLEIINKAFSRK